MEAGSKNFKLPDHIVRSMGLGELNGGELDINRVADLAVARLPNDMDVEISLENSVAAENIAGGVTQNKTVDPLGLLLIAVETDEGACLETDAVAMLADLHANNQAEYLRVRNKLKKANKNVSLAALDKSVTQALKAEGLPDTHHVFAKDSLKEQTHDGHKPVSADGVLYVLDPSANIWRPVSQEQLENKVAQLHDGKPNCERRSDYSSIAVHAMNLVSSVNYFAAAPVGVACKGGFYYVAGGQIKETLLKPDHRQRLMLDFTPKQMATPMFGRFLHETFQSEREMEEVQQT